MNTFNNRILMWIVFGLILNGSLSLATAQTKKIARVFILAGQSNMTGQGVVDLDHPEHYNGGKGNLETTLQKPENQAAMAHLRANGQWMERDDVFVWYRTKTDLRTGPLTVGFTGYSGQHHFGPELQFGHVVGDAFDEPVLLIKTAWGGKSLNVDFRPPGAGGKTGPYYQKMLSEIDEALAKAPQQFEALGTRKLVVSGFVWQQGWNDMIDQQATANYTTNLDFLIRDIRQHFGDPELPFVIGELGNGGTKVNQGMKRFRRAQSSIIGKGYRNVRFVPTAMFARPAEESPNVTHEHHWYGNAESYFWIGDALGKTIIKTIRHSDLPKVLILGDSISMGYMPFVKQKLEKRANVFRPMRTHQNGENCEGTDKGIQAVDRWLEIDGGEWDLIHFNFGLHDLKRVNAQGKNSNNPQDAYQSSPEEYRTQLHEIIRKLKATNAKLILATTTPVPGGDKPVRPYRDPTDPPTYNAIAKELAQEFEIEVNDLFEFANARLGKIQIPANVHFTRKGSKILADEVARKINSLLDEIED